MLRLYPVTLREANALVTKLHRHHAGARGCKFCVAVQAQDETGQWVAVGVAIAGRPVARVCDNGTTLEVVRLATNGHRNACSMLYSAVARAARALGYHKVQTYLLETESGTSLRAAGWQHVATVRGKQWTHTNPPAPRRTDQPTCAKQRWECQLVHSPAVAQCTTAGRVGGLTE